jgi:hypothetical protein
MKNQIRKLLTGMVLIALTLLGGCSKQQPASASGDSDGQPQDSLVAKIDKHGEEIMASKTKAEARDWVKQPGHVFFKADAKEVARFVEEFYQAGATQVLIADIEENDGKQFGEALLVVLPRDAGARAKVFEVGSRADTAYQNDPVTDKGQKYLYYSLD